MAGGEWRPGRDHLIVLDYVIAELASVRTLLGQCARAAGSYTPHRVRLLLIEREEDSFLTGQLVGESHSGEEVRLTRHRPPTLDLSTQGEDHLWDLTAAFRRDAKVDRAAFFERHRLIDPQSRTLTALILAEAYGVGADTAGTLESLLGDLIKRDRRRFWRGAGLRSDVEEPILAFATLAGSYVGERDGRLLPETIRTAKPNFPALATISPLAGPDTGGGTVGRYLPDLIGEYFGLEMLAASDDMGGSAHPWLYEAAWRSGDGAGMRDFAQRARRDFPKHRGLARFQEPVPGIADSYYDVAEQRLGDGHFTPAVVRATFDWLLDASDSAATTAAGDVLATMARILLAYYVEPLANVLIETEEQLAPVAAAGSDAPRLAWIRAVLRLADLCQRVGKADHAATRLEYVLSRLYPDRDALWRALAQGKIADILYDRGELDEALRIRRDEQLLVHERLGDARSVAIIQGKIADILYDRGELDEALHIRRGEELPVFERLGDVRERAVTQGKIADILQRRGDLDEALRILRDEQLPVFGQLGDAQSLAITHGRVADVMYSRGELDEALRIRREEELPVYRRLGDARAVAITQGQIAEILSDRGESAEALKIWETETLPHLEAQNDRAGIAHVKLRMARTRIRSGLVTTEDVRAAFDELAVAWFHALYLRDPGLMAMIGPWLGQMLLRSDNVEQATEVFEASLAGARKLGQDNQAALLSDLLAQAHATRKGGGPQP